MRQGDHSDHRPSGYYQGAQKRHFTLGSGQTRLPQAARRASRRRPPARPRSADGGTNGEPGGHQHASTQHSLVGLPSDSRVLPLHREYLGVGVGSDFRHRGVQEGRAHAVRGRASRAVARSGRGQG